MHSSSCDWKVSILMWWRRADFETVSLPPLVDALVVRLAGRLGGGTPAGNFKNNSENIFA
ncbi:hypothetical protein ABIA22_006287 [Sinorhizobium fredii]